MKNFMDKNQKLNIPLKEIVPQYKSKNLFVKWLFNKRLEVASSYITKINPNKVLDLGCGDGTFIKKIKKKFPEIEVCGVDPNPNVIILNNIFKEKIFRRGNIFSLSLHKNNFDVIVCLDVLEHIKDLFKGIEYIKGFIKKNGYLIISEPTENFFYKSLRFLHKGTYSQEKGPEAGPHYWNAKEVDKIIRLNGFKRLQNIKIPVTLSSFDLFHINLYIKNG